ncbi:MAG: hypothetical protein VX311_09985, partial [Planctomycetota bacterium]|nr:hypothetical protein [Planctomycetota bacterium]
MFRSMLVLVAQFVLATTVPGTGVAAPPLAVGQRTQLLVDDHVVASRRGLTRRLGQVTKVNGGKPIFRDGIFYGTVLHDGGLFKLWWRKRGKVGYGYSESRDGIHFTKRGDVSGINFAGDFTLTVMIDPHET